MLDQNTVSCRNINIIAAYVSQQLGSDALLFSDLEYPVDYLKDEHHWIPLSLYNDIMDRAIDLLKDPQAPYKMGFSAFSLGSWGGLFKYMQQIFVAVVTGPPAAYKRMGYYNTHFNKTKNIAVWGLRDGECYIQVKFKNNVDPVDDYHSDMFIQGLMASFPRNWKLPPATITSVTKEYDLFKLLTDVGGLFEGAAKLHGATLLLNGKDIGKKVRLLDVRLEQKSFAGYVDAPADASLTSADIALRITEDVEINKRLTLRAGEIYNAPFFLYHVTWKPMTFINKIKHLSLYSFGSKRAYIEGMESSLNTIRHYVETLEEKVIERTRQLHKSKLEAEYWRDKADQLLSTMLPEHIVKAMMEGRLQAREIQGTVMYTDLADFTAYSKSISPQVIEKQLTKYFTEMSDIITKYDGWVNKFLGDGILVIFGLEDGAHAVENAAKAALEMDRVIDKYPWLTRIGIATGPFVIGEFGSDTLRRFDCIGHTMNLGSRLQGLADSGQTLVCAKTHELLTEKGYGLAPARMVYAKGIGEILAYPLVSLPKEIKKRVSKSASRAKMQSA
ncbi:MAG: hypothetical protein NT019_01660 [Candidatus Adlerbacteria bacterium]|nr:hypothetical protein [Candidatus Adlerbacteria bacterium]